MMSTNDGGRAYPSGEQYTTTDVVGNTYSHSKAPFHAGMSLRDWFAGQAREEDVRFWRDTMAANGVPTTREEAKYIYADRMLAARERESR